MPLFVRVTPVLTFFASSLRSYIIGRDSTVRIWSNSARNEVAKLVHNSSVKSVVWLEDDTYSPHVQPAAIASLGTNGIVNLWTLTVREDAPRI